MDIRGKKTIVTGGASGLGRELAVTLHTLGATVGIFDVNEQGIGDMQKHYPDIVCYRCDVTSIPAIQQAVDDFCKRYAGIDILVNNAGIVFNSLMVSFSKEGFKAHDPALWDKVISTNLSAVFYVTSHVIQKMIAHRTKGLVINVSSICAAGNAGQSAYSAAKAGVNALTVTWAKELGPFGIRVAALAPGFIETETTIRSMESHVLDEWKNKTPKRRIGQVSEAMNGFQFIIENDFFNGRILEIDGGLRI